MFHLGRSALLACTAIGVLACSSSCASAPARSWALASDALHAPPERDLGRVTTYDAALSSILDVLEHDLGLPRLEVTLVFVPDDPAFEALLLDLGYDGALARETAAAMTAIGGHRRVLINQGRLDRGEWPRRVSLLAHEMVHVLQYELGGARRGTSDQWLREGFAEWLSARVLEQLGLVDLGDVRLRATLRLRRTRDAGPLPPLDELATFRQWVARGADGSGPALYNFAFVAADCLVRRHGLPAVLDYFGRFAARQDREANFEGAFGEDLRAFEARFWAEIDDRDDRDGRRAGRD